MIVDAAERILVALEMRVDRAWLSCVAAFWRGFDRIRPRP